MNRKIESLEKFCIKKELDFSASRASTETCYITKYSDEETYPEIRISNHTRFGVFEEDFIRLEDYSILEIKEILARIFEIELDKRDLTLLTNKILEQEKNKILEQEKNKILEQEQEEEVKTQINGLLCGDYDLGRKAFKKNKSNTRKWVNLTFGNSFLCLEIQNEDVISTIKNYCTEVLNEYMDFTVFENRFLELCKNRNISL